MISVRISVFCLLNFLFLFPTKTFAQNQDEFVNQFMNEYFPKQYTSSPTASNLLEFYEYPLNNYTGLPSISFPIFSTTAKYNLGVRLSLDYHPNAVKHDNVAGYTGLGWTLVGAGGISRTVRDIPDNYFQNHKRLRDDFYKKVGIHHTENIYYQIFQSIQALFPFAGLPNTSIVDTDIYNQFLFETLAKKKFDSQEDYYHYNFFGYSGKFLLRKAGSNYSVVKLSNDNLKISYNSTLDSFEIQDTSGFVYSFVEKEYSHTSLLTQGTWWDVNPERLDYTQVLEIPFVSNYQITEVKQGMQTLVSFQYSTNQEGYNEGTTSANLTLNESVKRIPEIYSIFEDNSAPQMKFSFLPIQSLQMTITTIQSKVLKQINIHNKARIIFDIKKNARNDKKLSHKINAPYLNQIEVHDWNNSLVKKINFSYDFADRMFLNQIVEVATNQEVQKTQFQYFLKDQEAPTAKDLWGYSATPSIFCDYHEKVDKKLMKKDVLMQIIYPTGGSVYFEYEPNTFSHIQTQDLEDRYLYPDLPAYIENKDNYILEDFQNFVFSISPTPLQMLPVVEQQNLQYFSQDKDFYVVKNTSDIDQGWLFIEKYATNGSYIGIVGVQANVNCPQKVRLEGGFNYKVKFVWNLSTPGNGSISFTEIIPTSNQKKFLYGGGFRVKNIYYLEKPVNGVEEIQSNTINLSNLYENQLIKKTSFDYNFFSDNSKSSGALVSNYPVNINNHWKRVRYDGIWPSMPDFLIEDNFALEYNTHSEIDMQQTNLSQGSHVGYKQVTKVDSNPNVLTPLLDNSTPFGKMRFEYLSPIDTVQLIQNYRYQSSGYPFVSSPNADYKFGKPVYEQWIDSQSNLVQEKQYHYSFENRAEFSGFTPYYSNTQKTGADCPWVGYFQNYIQFKNYLAISVPPEQIVYWIPDSFPTLNDNNIVYPQGYPPTLLNLYNCGINNNIGEIGAFKPNIESYGWSRLDSLVEKQYHGGQTIISLEKYTYIDSLRLLKRKENLLNHGKRRLTEIFYPIDLYSNSAMMQNLVQINMIDKPIRQKVTELQNGIEQQLMAQEFTYQLVNEVPLPQNISQSKQKDFQDFTINEQELVYDIFLEDKLLQYTLSHGEPVSIIWGYHGMLPIAKIQGVSYASIQHLVSNLQTLSNQDSSRCVEGCNENTLRAALNALRDNPALSEAMITTYTHDPLIGVTSITTPDGNTTYYDYDGFGRLISTKDQQGNLVEDIQYQYRALP